MDSELKGACDGLCGLDARNEHVYIFPLLTCVFAHSSLLRRGLEV